MDPKNSLAMKLCAGTLMAATIVLAVADRWVHRSEHFHPHFPMESYLGFYTILGAFGPLLLVIPARLLLPVIRKRNDETTHHA